MQLRVGQMLLSNGTVVSSPRLAKVEFAGLAKSGENAQWK